VGKIFFIFTFPGKKRTFLTKKKNNNVITSTTFAHYGVQEKRNCGAMGKYQKTLKWVRINKSCSIFNKCSDVSKKIFI
jgi:hypothetical protein